MPHKAKTATPVSWAEKQEQLSAVDAHLRDARTWTAFCDGSSLRNPGPSGAGALVVLTLDTPDAKDGKEAKKESGYKVVTKSYSSLVAATNNQMELKGLELSLDLLEQQHRAAARARPQWVVMTDSEYVRGLFEKGNTAHANADIVERLRERIAKLTTELGITIRIQWVRAHCGIHFNEVCDKLARDAAKLCEKKIGSSKPHTKKKKPTTLLLNRTKPKPRPKPKPNSNPTAPAKSTAAAPVGGSTPMPKARSPPGILPKSAPIPTQAARSLASAAASAPAAVVKPASNAKRSGPANDANEATGIRSVKPCL